MVELRTKRLLLRPATPDDLEAFHGILKDARAMAYWSTAPHGDIAETRKWLASMIDIDPSQGEDFVIDLNGRLIGKAGLYRYPEIGFILHPDEWGKGYAREALHAVLTRAFGVHHLPRVEADVDPRNDSSLRLLTRLGFREIRRASRTWKIGGKWCDSVYLEVTKGQLTGSISAPLRG
jgi:RimJ/RimL family protein N-acetyltransferase